MKKIVSAIVMCSICLVQPSAYAEHWADGYYQYLQTEGVINTDVPSINEEKMDAAITRQEFICLLTSALFGAQPPRDEMLTFEDFSAVTRELTGYIGAAYDNQIITGAEDQGKLYVMPNAPITREEAVTIIGRALELSVNLPNEFADSEAIEEYAANYVVGCEKTAIISGYDDGEFKPKNNVTWAESLRMVSTALSGGYVRPNTPQVVAGNSTKGAYDGLSELAAFNAPHGVYVNGGTIYIADTDNNLIRKVSNGKTSVFAGKIIGYDRYSDAINVFYNSDALKSLFARPVAILYARDSYFILDRDNHAIRRIVDGEVTTYAGTGREGKRDGAKSTASFRSPQGFCADEKGNLYVADTGNDAVRMVKVSGVSTVAKINSPSGIAYRDGILYVTSSTDNKIYKIVDEEVIAIAGADTGLYDDDGNMVGDFRDGAADAAYFSNPTGIAVAADGTIYVADTGNSLIRKIKDGVVGTVSGFGKSEYFVAPRGLYLDGSTLYVTDSFLNTVVKLEVDSEG